VRVIALEQQRNIAKIIMHIIAITNIKTPKIKRKIVF
jgi:hypothetical protein